MADKLPDIDQKLSSDYGQYLEGRKELQSIEDPVFPVLLSFKEERFKPVENSGKNEVWRLIDQEISEPSKIYTLKNQINLKYWAVAATVLIASFIGIYFTVINRSPDVILETYAEAAEVSLEDGTNVILRPYSRLTVLKYTEKEHRYSLEGEGYFNVAKEENREFSVVAGNAEVSVLGTRFNLSNWGNATQVYLEEGSVRFKHVNTSSQVILEPGESAQTTEDGEVNRQTDADSREFNDWRNGQLIFTGKELAGIVAEIEHHFNVQISIPEQLKLVILSGGLNLESPEKSLNYLALTLDGEFEKISEKQYRFIPATE